MTNLDLAGVTMAQNVYEVRLKDGSVYHVTTPHHHDDHDEKTFKDHLLDIIKSTIAGGLRHDRSLRVSWSPMKKSHIGLAALLAVGVLAGSAQAFAADSAPSPAEIAARRQAALDEMLTAAFQPSLIANVRQSCALGMEPSHVVESRNGGAYFTPDAADSCVMALVRTAHDNRLTELYAKLLPELGGNAGAAEQLPRVIGAAVMGGNTKVAIGNGKVAEVTPALAFDAGFTVAYQAGDASNGETANSGQLKDIAEVCLAQQRDAKTCFSAGYVYGAQALSKRNASRS